MARKKVCRKTPHETPGAAEAAIAAMARRWPSLLYKRVYRCGTCKAWHITSTPRALGRPKRVRH